MKNEFKLNDFYQSVILMTVGFTLLRLERGNSKFAIFVFSDPDSEASKVIENYWNRKIKCDARDLIENINQLKTRLYTEN